MELILFTIAVLYSAIFFGLVLLYKAPPKGFAFLSLIVVCLNVKYGTQDVGENIAFFIGVFDPIANVGVSDPSVLRGLSKCNPGSNCSTLSQYFDYHPASTVDFYERYAKGPVTRKAVLYVHVWCNTVALVLSNLQVHEAARGRTFAWHKFIGRSVSTLTLCGVGAAVWLGSEHHGVATYGSSLGVYGWYFMALTVWGCLIPGVLAAKRKDIVSHKKWMIRYYGSMWGAFLVFRLLFLVCGPLLRDHESASSLVSIWFSTPIGIGIAEFYRRRMLTRESKQKYNQ